MGCLLAGLCALRGFQPKLKIVEDMIVPISFCHCWRSVFYLLPGAMVYCLLSKGKNVFRLMPPLGTRPLGPAVRSFTFVRSEELSRPNKQAFAAKEREREGE